MSAQISSQSDYSSLSSRRSRVESLTAVWNILNLRAGAEFHLTWPTAHLFFTASSSVWFRQKWLSGSQNPRRQPFLWIFVSSGDAKGIWYWRFSSFVCSFHNLGSSPLITCFSVLHKTRGARWVKDAPNKWDVILLGLILGQYLNIFCRKAAGLSFVYSLFLISVV